MQNKKYDIVIIGGGIIGSALAFELAKRRAGRILLVEKKYPTAGASGRCNAGYRRFWASDFYLDLVNPSIDVFENINDYTGYPLDCEVTKTGYMFPMYCQADINEFGEYIRFQNSRGVNSSMISPAEIKEIIQGFNTEGVMAAAWSPDDGHLNPFQCTFAYIYGARNLGVEVMNYTEVQDIVCRNGKVAEVVTDKGSFEAERVYNCTNTGALSIGMMVGDYIPITRELRQTMIVEKTAALGTDGKLLPLIVNIHNGTWIKQCPNGTLMMGKAESRDFSGNELEWDFMKKSAHYNAMWLPEIRKLRMIRQYEGEYDNSPDLAPFILNSPNAEGLTHVCGFSGHGLMIAPEFCKLIAQAHCGEKTDLYYEQFSAERFMLGELMNDPLSV